MRFTRHLSLPALLLAGSLLVSPASAVEHKTAVAKPAAHHTSTAAAHVKKPRKVTPKMLAARSRMKQCGQEWKRDKAAGKTKGTTWPKYWHNCSVRLKAGHA